MATPSHPPERPTPPDPQTRPIVRTARIAGSAALTLGLAITGAAVFYWLRLPLPIFLGSLTFCLIGTVAGLPLAPLRPALLPARAVLGFAVGAAFTPDLLRQLPAMAPTLLLIVPFSVLIISIGQRFFQHVAGYDAPTAFFSSVPGGLNDIIAMADEAGAHQRTVALIQSTRVVILVFAVPVWLKFTDGVDLGGALPRTVPLADSRLMDLAVLALVSFVGWRVGTAVGLAGAAIVGPMLASAMVHAAGLTAAIVPFELMSAAQLALGLWLGSRFKGLTFAELRSTLAWGTIFTFIILALSAALAAALSHATAVPHLSVLLAFAPGGQAELNLVAFILGADLAYVALHHLIRLAAVIAYAQWTFARQGWGSGGTRGD